MLPMVSPVRKQVKSVCLCVIKYCSKSVSPSVHLHLRPDFAIKTTAAPHGILRLEEEVRQEEADETQSGDNLDGDAFCALWSRGSSDLGGFRNVGGARALALSQAFWFRGRSSNAPCTCEITLHLLFRSIDRHLRGGSNRCGDIGVILVLGSALRRRSVAAGGSVLLRRGVSRWGDGIRSLLDL